MKRRIEVNKENLPLLDAKTMTAIFDCIYRVEGELRKETTKLLDDEFFLYFIKMLNSIQEFNYRFRQNKLYDIYPLFERTVGPMENNSDGTVLWLAMGLAIKETYGMSNGTLENLMKLVNLKK
ncbi:hypothetical protein ACTL32_10470 [Planococcus sp. FY231025]|uniref:hypothetical protein n=1 Tax=Planococcus sp. FY231025 TaxID=3455699 RepID=UPI003F924C48